jgi:chromosome segregation ATPase
MELRAKVIELECVLGETRGKLSILQQEKSHLESQMSDAQEMLNRKQALTSALEEEKLQLTSALDEVHLVSGCKALVAEMNSLTNV